MTWDESALKEIVREDEILKAENMGKNEFFRTVFFQLSVNHKQLKKTCSVLIKGENLFSYFSFLFIFHMSLFVT